MLEDRFLIFGIKRGNTEAFRHIYDKYADILLTLAVNLLGNRQDAEDIVQDVFIKFAETADTFELAGSLKAYLAKCVTNKCRDNLRSINRHRNVPIDESQQILSSEVSPVQTAITGEETQRLEQALTEVSYEQREVLVLRINGNLKFREIANLQQIPVKTVISRYRYGLNQLRSLLNGEVQNEDDK